MFEHRLLHFIDRVYGWVIGAGSCLQSLLLLYMRLVWGHQFFLTGLHKLQNIQDTSRFFGSLGINYSEFVTYSVAIFETVGGILLFVGLISRLAAIPLIVIMVVALSIVHPEAFDGFKFFFEPLALVHQAPYPFLLTSLLVFIFGPGRFSVDAWIKRWASKQPKL